MTSPKAIWLVVLYFSTGLCADPDLSGCEVAAKTEQGYVCGRKRKAANGKDYASFRGIPYAKQPLGELRFKSLRRSESIRTKVAAKAEQGYVCGRKRKAADGEDYASFRGIPYAKQPLGELRFKELQPAEPFNGVFNATEAGPICAQVDVFYQPNGLVSPTGSGEDCIRINVHVPNGFLPDPGTNSSQGLPVLFWIHGGSFGYGSGDADVHGPEYLMTRDMILVTINYRLHAFGFLSLDNEYIPGNNGLRDAVTALKWVQRNIGSFGGDPNKVTVAGQSAGGVMAHMLSISPAANGLFKQVIGSSGQSIASFYSYSQVYAKLVNAIFFIAAGINPLQTPKKLHDDLVAAPLEKILSGTKAILDTFGLVSFAPVIEGTTPRANFTTILPKSPEDLLDEGAGKEYPMIIGFCSNEAADFEQRLRAVAIETKLRLVPALTLPQNLLFSANILTVPVLTTKQLAEYFNVTFITLEKFLVAATDSYYKYPGMRLTQKRLSVGAAKTYIYQFGYPGERSPIKVSLNTTYPGAAHIEDITYFFRFNTFLGPQESNELEHTSNDNKMKDFMTTFITNFVINGSPADEENNWPPSQQELKFQNIETPLVYNFTDLTPYMKDKLEYFTRLYKIGLGE